ncbi:MAG: hypothetical protein K2X74_03465, partial [Acetobacteraceae bacterium]|nr:hypothetical protein [Acetobacteraceae bacterium]
MDARLPLRTGDDGGLRRAADPLFQAQGLALRRLPALAALLSALAATPAAAQDPAPGPPPATCPRAGAADLRVRISDPDPTLRTEAGIDALHALTGRPRTHLARHLALTTSRIEWLTAVRARVTRLAAEGVAEYCAVPAEISITLEQQEHLIRIAREVPEGGCLFAEVEAHERRHVTVNRDALRRAARHARTAAEAWART